MKDQTVELEVKIDCPNVSSIELDDLTQQLRDEIEQISIDSVKLVKSDDIPEGAMSGDWIQIGSMIVKLSPIVLPPLLAILKSWIDRKQKELVEEKISIKINFNNFSFELEKSMSNKDVNQLDKKLRLEIDNKNKIS